MNNSPRPEEYNITDSDFPPYELSSENDLYSDSINISLDLVTPCRENMTQFKIEDSLNPEIWSPFEKLNGSPDGFCYVRVPGHLSSPEIKNIIAGYLSCLKLERPDIPLSYQGDGDEEEDNIYDFYFVLTENEVCAGVFIFRKADYSPDWEEYLNGCKMSYDHLYAKKNRKPFFQTKKSPEEEVAYLKGKLERIDNKIKKLSEYDKPLFFLQNYKSITIMIQEYACKKLICEKNIFYIKAKSKLTGKEKRLPFLDTAWIHPDFRGRGLFRIFFECFKREYPCFSIREVPNLTVLLDQKGINYSELVLKANPDSYYFTHLRLMVGPPSPSQGTPGHRLLG